MAEIAFANAFLASVNSRPQRFSGDHVEDPKNYPARTPYILAKMSRPMSKPTTLAPGQERSLTVTLKSLRNPPLDIKLTSQPPNTSLLDIKAAVAEQARIPADKIKLLHKKRPVPDSKVLKELVASEGEALVEFSVMIVGGAAAVAAEPSSASTPAATPAADGEAGDAAAQVAVGQSSGEDVLGTDEFWQDLEGFLQQRLKDEQKAKDLSVLFKSTWKSSSS